MRLVTPRSKSRFCRQGSGALLGAIGLALGCAASTSDAPRETPSPAPSATQRVALAPGVRSSGTSAMAATSAQERSLERRVAQIREGTPPDDATPLEREAVSRLQRIEALRAALQEVVERLPAEQAAAQALQRRVEAARKVLGPVVVDEVLARVKASEPADGTGHESARLIQEARKLDDDLARMVQLPPLTPPQDASAAERQLLQEVRTAQDSLEPLATAARMTFRALAVLARLQAALPELEAHARSAPVEGDLPR